MAYIYRDIMTFDVDYPIEGAEGWTADCNGKLDYDPMIVTLSCRTYRDGSYGCSVYLGEHEVFGTGIQDAPSQLQARVIVEQWCDEQAQKIAAAVRAIYPA